MSEPYINAADYGTTFDAAQMQSAMDATHTKGGGTLVVPGGTSWTFESTVEGYENIRLVIDDGAYITCDAGGLPLFYWYDSSAGSVPPGYTGRSGIIVEGGGTLDMRGHETLVSHNCMTFMHGADITVRDITIKNVCDYHACEPHACKNVHLDNLKLLGWNNTLGTANTYREAVQVDSVNYVGDDGTPVYYLTMENCYVGPSDECGSWGAGIGSHTSGAQFHRYIDVSKNHFESPLSYGVDVLSWSDSKVMANTVYQAGSHGIQVRSDTGMDGTRLKVHDNLVTYPSGNGIRFSSVANDRYTNCSVQGNTVMNSGSNGVYLADMDRATVLGNNIRTVATNYGLQAGGGSTETITECVIVNNHISDVATAAIRVNYAQHCIITGNKGDGGMSVGGTNTGTVYSWAGATTAPGQNLL